ncbi:MAG: NAD(+) synthase, partial [bacterium]|nr:NAD(+) synthase [bacterium]
LADNMGIEFHIIPIEPVYAALTSSLAPVFEGLEEDVTEENIQARVRGNILMAMSNKFGRMLLTTGNKSEVAVGYSTLYGDMAGGFNILKDVPKTLVYELSRYVNKKAGRQLIPENSITKPPSAELRPGQIDEDSLPPYDILDSILESYVEEHKSSDEIIALGYEPELVRKIIRLVDLNEYKRRQAAPGVKITPTAFGRDRRMPIVNRYNELGIDNG